MTVVKSLFLALAETVWCFVVAVLIACVSVVAMVGTTVAFFWALAHLVIWFEGTRLMVWLECLK